jgi:hypothetical protein
MIDGQLSNYPVSDLKLYDMPGHPRTPKELNFEVFEKNQADYKLYVTASYIDPSTRNQRNFIFEHQIDFYDSYNKDLLFERNLGDTCGDQVLASQSLLLVACEQSAQIRFVERENMFLFDNTMKVLLPESESFYAPTGILMNSDFKPSFVHLVARTIHNFVIYSTYNSI